MGLNKSKGQMYSWIMHTWNPIRGRCPHECSYCYMKPIWDRFGPNEISFCQQDLTIKLDRGKKIFIGSSIDMFAEDIPEAWIFIVLAICQNYPNNEYLFQTKNPKKLFKLKNNLPPKSILGITLESNREYPELSKAPSIMDRLFWMNAISKNTSHPRMISIEPILDFDLDTFIWMIKQIHPSFVSIGANSKHHHLPEPSLEKVGELLSALKPITKIKIKDNLKRLL